MGGFVGWGVGEWASGHGRMGARVALRMRGTCLPRGAARACGVHACVRRPVRVSRQPRGTCVPRGAARACGDLFASAGSRGSSLP